MSAGRPSLTQSLLKRSGTRSRGYRKTQTQKQPNTGSCVCVWLRCVWLRLDPFCVCCVCVWLRSAFGGSAFACVWVRICVCCVYPFCVWALASTILRLARSCVCVWLRLRLAAFAFAAFGASCVWLRLDGSAQPWPDGQLAGCAALDTHKDPYLPHVSALRTDLTDSD